MEKVVYLLGAGFSAPLGLPLVSNFRFKSQDMFLDEPDKYAYFKEVFDTIGTMSVGKNFYQADLYNIEEILSTLEMADYLEGKRLKETFIKYIIDVIKYFTPPFTPYNNGQLPGNWTDFLFSNDSKWNQYGYFVSNLLNLRFLSNDSSLRQEHITCADDPQPQAKYSVITFNYDVVLEMVCHFCNQFFQVNQPIKFSNQKGIAETGYNRTGPVWLSKLHGSVDNNVIVPPTWSKGVNQEIVPAWRLAYELLSDATHLRIIGFSLPLADAYVKYLLKSAAIQNRFLKRIDVICLDNDGTVKARYDDFIKFNGYRFKSADTLSYLELNKRKYDNSWTEYSTSSGFILNKLEDAHEEFMTR